MCFYSESASAEALLYILNPGTPGTPGTPGSAGSSSREGRMGPPPAPGQKKSISLTLGPVLTWKLFGGSKHDFLGSQRGPARVR